MNRYPPDGQSHLVFSHSCHKIDLFFKPDSSERGGEDTKMMTSSCINSVSFFEENDKKYRTCCIHVKKGAKLTGVIDLAQGFLLALVVFAIVKRDARTHGENPTIGASKIISIKF